MGYCIGCGCELEMDATFCAACGKRVNVSVEEKNRRKKMVIDGELHKCPNCGELLNSFVTVCPVCGHELRGAGISSCVHELAQKLEKTDADEQKIELISNFYIPNTKEDILEFFILAYSQITSGGYGTEAWLVKLEQAFLKAKFTFGDSAEYEHVEELYHKCTRQASVKRRSRSAKGYFLFGIGLFLAIASLLAYEILHELEIYMYDSLHTVTILGVVCFIAGLGLILIPDVRIKKNTRK